MMKQSDDNGPRPWDRQPGESAVAWTAFTTYRDAGPVRSLEKAGAKLGRTRNAVGLHSARWRWTSRAAAYDEWMDREAIAATVDAKRQAAARHAELGASLQAAAAERLATLPTDTLTARDIVTMSKAGVDIERAALGMTDHDDAVGDGKPMIIATISMPVDDL